jgi:exosome complex RNA-binding protein Rrp42 (RNase PH superfamily)
LIFLTFPSLSPSFFLLPLDGDDMVIDPSLKEETIAETSFTLTFNAHKEMLCLQKAGGVSISVDNVCSVFPFVRQLLLLLRVPSFSDFKMCSNGLYQS